MSYYEINTLEEYFKHYKKSIRAKKFWDKIATENFTGYQQWDKVVDFNMAGNKMVYKAKVNITKNCIDRHLAKKVIKQPSFLNPMILLKRHCTFLQ
jgi:acetyl-CoA synthetase